MNSSSSVSIVFANLKGNVGDFAILDAMIRRLAYCYPGRSIEVFDQGRLRIDDERFGALREQLDVPFTYRGPVPRLSLDTDSGFLGRHVRWHRRRMQAQQVCLAAKEMETVVADCGLREQEAIFFPGGALWSGGELAVNMFGLLEALAKTGSEMFTFPFSVHPSLLKNNRAADLRRYFGHLNAPLLVRDSRSRATLEQAGVDSALMPDTVFSLPPLSRAPLSDRARAQVGFAVAECRGQDRTTFERMLKSLRDSGVDPVLVTTCVPEDGEFLRSLAASLELPLWQPLGWQEAVRQLQSLDLFISNRLHGMIFAFLGSTPVIPMTNRDKVAGVATDASLSRRVEQLGQITPHTVAQWIEETGEIVAEMTRYTTRARAAWGRFTLGRQSPSDQRAA
jgi:polysaccharide pyruvyl transferase WcaK-like protein